MNAAILVAVAFASSGQSIEVTSDDGKTKITGRGVVVADDIVLTASNIVQFPTIKVKGKPAAIARVDRQKGLVALRVEGLGIRALSIGSERPQYGTVRILASRPFDALMLTDELIAIGQGEPLRRVPATGVDIGSAVVDDKGQLVAIFTGGVGNQVHVAWLRPAPPPVELPPGKSGYHMVKPGMTFAEVQEILGYSYSESASSANSVLMVWDYSDYTDGFETVDFIHCMFVDDKLVSKSKSF